ncbi:putative WD40 domain-containing protein [Encephalitozoon romaleae SJ-2008]|uniref:WD40 domain-containing protein n=1 Tax=Encephalitozoon romaleae (strain SJ-2008) TaxID=1178016 RepID=I7AUC8_ENCRO|nr:putative WD40 domain-containing protein [Encephalitozoon romaleae SJ-2008]AFN84087.1 putative WD40 domain-containing protein [Encephalitozoon romaleae SJ-2008]
MVYFRSKNFGIADSSRESFDTVYEQEGPITSLCCCKDGIVVGCKNRAVVIKKGENKKKKIVKFDRDISAIDAWEDLTAYGDEGGEIKVVGRMRTIVRHYQEHEARVNEIKINEDMLISCSDDMKIKIFELSRAESVATIAENTDYVKSIDVGDGMIFSGSYDGFINGYSLSTFKRVFEHNTKRRVSKVRILGGGRVAFASGNEVCVIDVENGGKEIGKAFHIKEVTSMVFYAGRLYTVSLDANVRVFTTDLRMISKIGVQGGILSISIFDDVLCLGLEDREVLELAKEQEKKDVMELRYRGNELEDEAKIDVVPNPLVKFSFLERRLNAFEYKKSMIHAMEKRDIQKVFAVMNYIHEKQKFEHALQDLNRREVERILDVIIEFFTVRELVPVFSECIETILSLYERDIRDDSMLSRKIEVLGAAIDDELYFQEENLRSIAFLECFRG